MNKIQALHSFWSGFGLRAYDETHVPDYITIDNQIVKNEPPYITYEVSSDSFGEQLAQTASLWYRSTSWAEITTKEMEIANAIGRGGKMISYEGGAFWVRKGSPWAQRMADASDDSIRRITLNIVIEFVD